MTLTLTILTIIICLTCALGFTALLFDRLILGQVLLTICAAALIAAGAIAIVTYGIVW